MVNFDEKLTKAETTDELKELKVWLFQEQVRIQAQKDELIELGRELQLERRLLERDRNALDKRVKAENVRFRDNEAYVEEKKKIIENAFRQLALDKKALECERLNLDFEKNRLKKERMANARNQHMDFGKSDGPVFFCGVDNQLALRKRYKELLKIFHPDNKCGDSRTLMRIQAEYESLRRDYYEV